VAVSAFARHVHLADVEDDVYLLPVGNLLHGGHERSAPLADLGGMFLGDITIPVAFAGWKIALLYETYLGAAHLIAELLGILLIKIRLECVLELKSRGPRRHPVLHEMEADLVVSKKLAQPRSEGRIAGKP
jgi:hypothetical protein